jgi:hypothetical protein
MGTELAGNVRLYQYLWPDADGTTDLLEGG